MSWNSLARIGLAVTMLGLAAMLLTGCSKGLSEAEVAYAGPMLDNILAGIAERDYDKFARDFSPRMKEAVKQADFDSLVTTLEAKLGEYEARSFTSAAKTKSAAIDIIVAYQARYSKDNNVAIKLYFSDRNGKRAIEGLLIDSPALQQ